MSDESCLQQTFLQYTAKRVAAALASLPNLDALLQRVWEEGHAAWPQLSLEREYFLKHLATCMTKAEDPERALKELHVADFYLASACATGDSQALSVLEELLAPEVNAVLKSRGRRDAVFADDLYQSVRERLFVPPAKGAPKIAEYSGRGSLSGWLRVVATRTALNLRRQEHELTDGRESISSDDVESQSRLANAGSQADPENVLLKERYRRDFQKALEVAVNALSAEERNVLRLHFLEGLEILEISSLLQVHRNTVTRWITLARERLWKETRRWLTTHLRLTAQELESLLRAYRDSLDVSLSQLLKNTPQL